MTDGGGVGGSHEVVGILESVCKLISTDQPVRMQTFRDLSAAAKNSVKLQQQQQEQLQTAPPSSSAAAVLVEQVENLVSLAVAAQQLTTADQTAVPNDSNEQAFVVVSAFSEYKKISASHGGAPGGGGTGFDPQLEYQGDDATTNSNNSGGNRVLKVEEELVLKELSKLLVACGLTVPTQLQEQLQLINVNKSDHAAAAAAAVDPSKKSSLLGEAAAAPVTASAVASNKNGSS